MGVCGGHVAACHTFTLRLTAVMLVMEARGTDESISPKRVPCARHHGTGGSGNQGKANYFDGGTGVGGAARHFPRINALLTASCSPLRRPISGAILSPEREDTGSPIKYDTNDVIRSGFFLLLRRNGESLDKAYFLLAKLIAGPPPVLNFADVRW